MTHDASHMIRGSGGRFAGSLKHGGDTDLGPLPMDETPINPTAATYRAAGVVAQTDIGARRARNEDAVIVGPGFVVLADGMGGHGGGDRASRAAVEAAAFHIEAGPFDVHAAKDAATLANDAVKAVPGESARLAPGSTIVIAGRHRDGQRIVGVWCGDSRAYSHLPGSDTLEPITRDHASPWPPHALLSCLGDHDGFEPESFEVTPVPGQRILICSDGLTGMLDDDEIARILRNGGTVDDLVTAARPNSHDNITVALIDCDTFR